METRQDKWIYKKWSGDGSKAGDVDRRTSPVQGEGLTGHFKTGKKQVLQKTQMILEWIFSVEAQRIKS
jgi:hypothetical protein